MPTCPNSMNQPFLFVAVGLLLAGTVHSQHSIDPEREANTIILDKTGVENLRIQTELVEARNFESTVFAVGRIEEKPENSAALSSRISGRIVELNAFIGDRVEKGDVLAKVESRQPGSPPPVIDLIAPMSGTVIDSHVRLGEPVEPNQDVIDISNRSEMWAVAKIPENEAARIMPGTKARMHILALGEERVMIEMVKFGVEADREAGTVDGIFVVENPERRLKPGMRAEFDIIVSSRESVMAVPRESVQGDATKRVVFVKDFELPNAFVRVPVVLGKSNDSYVEVIRGLFPGDEVVTRGSYALSFAGSGGGMSLKEALDAAHGHEHNEDGSEMTPEQKAEKEMEKVSGNQPDEPPLWHWLILGWAAVATIVVLIMAQAVLKRKQSVPGDS